jgi:hypothetical protein
MVDGKTPSMWDSKGNWLYCRFCKHLQNFIGEARCTAFPEGIPEEILSGKTIHKKPLPGQENDFVLTPW